MLFYTIFQLQINIYAKFNKFYNNYIKNYIAIICDSIQYKLFYTINTYYFSKNNYLSCMSIDFDLVLIIR